MGAWRPSSQVGAGPDAPEDGRPHGGFYTQDDVREIVAYAAERFVTVVPEIETPGHVQAALAAYPELGVHKKPLDVWTRWGIDANVLNLEESTVQFFLNVFDEVVDLFPSRYIGVGGDECPREQWESDPRTQERMKELGITREADLQTWFIRRLDDHLTAKGRRLFGWDEILEGELAPGARWPPGAVWPERCRRPGAGTTWSPAPTTWCISTTGSPIRRTSRSRSPFP